MNTTGRDRIWNALRAIAAVAFAGVIASCGGGGTESDSTAKVSGASQRMRPMAVGQAAAGLPAIAAGVDHSMALQSDGSVWAWGGNVRGALGNGSTSPSFVPVQVLGPAGTGLLTDVSAIAGGHYHSLAVKSDGTVWAWGMNHVGQLGNNSTTDSSAPVQVAGPGGVGVLAGVTEVAAGAGWSLAVKSDGTVWAWGFNGYGQLGNNSTTDSSVPVQVVGPGATGGLDGVTSIAAGAFYGLARKTDGTVWAWGFNGNGQLGNNANINSSVPVQVVSQSSTGALTGVTAMAAGVGSGQSLALKSDGTVWAWGLNFRGMLGNNSTVDSSVPVQVLGPSGVGFLNLGVAIPAYYSITDLSPLIDSYSRICNTLYRPEFINNNGTLVGAVTAGPCAGGSNQGYALQPDSGVPPNQFGFYPVGLNDLGNVVGQHGFTASVYIGPPDGSSSAALATYTLSPFQLLATAINNHNQAVGYFRNGIGSEIGATLYSNSETTLLGLPTGMSYSQAHGINDAGTIVGEAAACTSTSCLPRAMSYNNGLWQDLSPIVGGESSKALGINNLGQIIGEAQIGSITTGYVLDGTIKSNIPAPIAGYHVYTRTINSFGLVLGQSQNPVSGATSPYVYSNGQSYDLNALIDPNSGWRIDFAFDINDNGQILVQALGADNTFHSLRLDPTGANPFPRTGTTPTLSLSPQNLDFGSVAVGGSKDLVLTVTNSGAGTLTGTATASGSFSVIAGAALSVTAGQSQEVTVRFAPATTGAAGSQLLIATNAGNRSIPLTGTGSAPTTAPGSCTAAASTASLPAGGGSVTLTATCLTGGAATTFVWTGGFAAGLTSNPVSGNVSQTTTFTVAAGNAGGSSVPASVTVTVAAAPPQAACASQVVPWTVGTSNCSAAYAGGQSGTSAALSDIIAPDTGTVTATCTNGQLTLTAPVCVTAAPPQGALPTVLSVSPASGKAGDLLTVRGADFGANQGTSYVFFSNDFGSVRATVSAWGDKRIRVVAPFGLFGRASVTVTTAIGSSAGVAFDYPTRIDLSIFTPIPPVLGRQDFGLFSPSSKPLELAFLTIATREKEKVAGEIADECYGGAMDAAWRAQRTKIISESIKKLYSDIFRAAPLVSTGTVYGDFLLKLAQESASAVVGGTSVSDAIVESVANQIAGYVIAKETNKFLANSTLALVDLSKDSIASLIDGEGVLAWRMSGSNLGTVGQRSGLWPLTSIQAKLYYNPWNHYTTAVIASTCQITGGTTRNLYVVTYENLKLGPSLVGDAEPKFDTYKILSTTRLN
jgi:Regulator of chromosome condensation (RCC1) repeat/Abnormal spindle-like microcephaly-assoc'd, ASPM-SPD-2-Hydin/IPT/TIG domain